MLLGVPYLGNTGKEGSEEGSRTHTGRRVGEREPSTDDDDTGRNEAVGLCLRSEGSRGIEPHTYAGRFERPGILLMMEPRE